MNKQLLKSIYTMLDQLADLLEQMPDNGFTKPLPVLSGATIGQHTRHILEFFIELNKGYVTDIVCYDKRKRDISIESNRRFALHALQSVRADLEKPDKPIMLQLVQEQLTVSTNYYRELVYNTEHAVHHMALLRIGVASSSMIELPEEFGVASSTISYRKECVQ